MSPLRPSQDYPSLQSKVRDITWVDTMQMDHNGKQNTVLLCFTTDQHHSRIYKHNLSFLTALILKTPVAVQTPPHPLTISEKGYGGQRAGASVHPPNSKRRKNEDLSQGNRTAYRAKQEERNVCLLCVFRMRKSEKACRTSSLESQSLS